MDVWQKLSFLHTVLWVVKSLLHCWLRCWNFCERVSTAQAVCDQKHVSLFELSVDKNIEKHSAHAIFSWPNPKEWIIVHTSDLMMIIRQSIYSADLETIGYGEFHNSLTFFDTGTEAMSTMGIAEHKGRGANVTIPVTNWDNYLSGWNLGNSVLQLVIEAFLFRFSSAHFRWVHLEGGNCLAGDQLEENLCSCKPHISTGHL